MPYEERAVLKEKRDAASAAVQKALGIKTGREEELSKLASDLKRSEADAEAAALRVEKTAKDDVLLESFSGMREQSRQVRLADERLEAAQSELTRASAALASATNARLTDRRKKVAHSCRRSAKKLLRRNFYRMQPEGGSLSPGRLLR